MHAPRRPRAAGIRGLIERCLCLHAAAPPRNAPSRPPPPLLPLPLPRQMAIIRSGEYAPAKAAFDAQWARQQAVLAKLSPDVLMRRWAGGVGLCHWWCQW